VTRRKSKQHQPGSTLDRQARIDKLIAAGWIADSSEIPLDAIPVDPDRLNTGGSCFPPKFYRAVQFTCCDCRVAQTWEAEDQRWYYETTRAPFYASAKRCRPCRKAEQERKKLARIAAGHAPEAAES
jgi:hypothetical protein